MEEERKLRSMQQRVRQGGGSRRASSDNFVAPVSDSEIEKYEERRRQRQLEQINKDLQGFRKAIHPHETLTIMAMVLIMVMRAKMDYPLQD